MGTGFLPDTKRPEREINLVPQSIADVENTWCYASVPPTSLRRQGKIFLLGHFCMKVFSDYGHVPF
jgi:hypothetical protein